MELFRKLKQKIDDGWFRELAVQLRWLRRYLIQFRWTIVIHILLGVLGTLLGLAGSVASKYLIDAVTGHQTGSIGAAAAWMIGLMLGNIAMTAIAGRAGAVLNVRVQNSIQEEVYRKILFADWQALEEFRSGDLLNRLTSDVGTLTGGVVSFIPSALCSTVQLIGALVIMVCHDPTMALISLLVVPVSVLFSRMMVRRMTGHSKEMKEIASDVMSFHQDSFQNLTSIKAFGITDLFCGRMVRMQQRYRDAYLSYNQFSLQTSAFLSLAGMLVSISCFGWGVYQLWTGAITYGTMTLFLQLASGLSSSFSGLVGLVPSMISLSTSTGRIMAVTELAAEATDHDIRLQQETEFSLSLENVSFSYQDGNSVLTGATISADPGDLVALTGPSGEGKTTLLRLLLGLVEPCSGEAVLLGGSGKQYDISAATRSAFAQCHRILTDRGMQTSQENPSEAYEVPYRDPNSHLYIELHKYLFPPQSEAYGDLNRFFETVRERTVSVQIQGHTVYTLDPTSHLFYLICHAFKHFLHSGFGIRQVCDIVLYANAYGEAVDWEQILQQCREIHGDKFAAALFAIGRKYLVFDSVRACWPQSWQDILVDERPMLEDLLAGGLYGGASMSRKHSSSITLEAVTARKQGKKRGNALLHSAFPSAEKLQQRYPYLQKHRFLLPLAWCSRLWTYRKETRNTADNNAAEALKIGAERVELMKLYGIVE